MPPTGDVLSGRRFLVAVLNPAAVSADSGSEHGPQGAPVTGPAVAEGPPTGVGAGSGAPGAGSADALAPTLGEPGCGATDIAAGGTATESVTSVVTPEVPEPFTELVPHPAITMTAPHARAPKYLLPTMFPIADSSLVDTDSLNARGRLASHEEPQVR